MKHRKGIDMVPPDGYRPTQPKSPDDHGFKTLADLREWHMLIASCPHCSWERPMDHEALANKLGKQTPLVEIKDRLYCRRCYNRDGNRLKVTKIPR